MSEEELLDSIDLGSARGGKRVARPLSIEIVRSLTEADLPLLQNPPPVGAKLPGLIRAKHAHHQLAQLLCKSGASEVEASLITGFSPSYISNLKNDPTFQELLAHYETNRTAVFVDVMERMKVLGLSTLDELQDRLEMEPEKFSRRELLEMADLMLLGPTKAGQGSGAGGGIAPSIALNVKFVSAGSGSGMVDVTPQATQGEIEHHGE